MANENLSGDDEDTGQDSQVEGQEQEIVEDDTPPPDIVIEDTQEDTRLADDQEDDERDGDDDADDPRARRRKESARDRRNRAKRAKQQDKEELQLLRTALAKQDERLVGAERALIETRVADFENRAATAQQYVQQWNEIDVKATKAGNVNDAVQARQYRDEAKKQLDYYQNASQELKRQLTQRPQATQQQGPLNAEGMALAREFLGDLPWYNPQSGDEDSLIAEALDKALGKQMNPNTPAYWKELRKRVTQRLPHRFNQDDAEDGDDDMDDDTDNTREASRQQRQQPAASKRKGPPTGGSGRGQGGGGTREIRVPAQLVEAMKEAGQWDDPKKRARVVQRYQQQLRNNRG